MSLDKRIQHQGLLTIKQHDERIDALIASGKAVVEEEPEAKRVVFSGIGCPQCGFRLMDIGGTTQTDPDGAKFRQCGCFRCGRRVWRRTP